MATHNASPAHRRTYSHSQSFLHLVSGFVPTSPHNITPAKMPLIKKEESEEPPIATIAPAVSPVDPSRSAKARRWFERLEQDDVKPLLQHPRDARQAHLAPNSVGLYHRSSPHTYRLLGTNNAAGRHSAVATPPNVGGLLSNLPTAVATGRVNTTTTMSRTTKGKTSAPYNTTARTHHTRHAFR